MGKIVALLTTACVVIAGLAAASIVAEAATEVEIFVAYEVDNPEKLVEFVDTSGGWVTDSDSNKRILSVSWRGENPDDFIDNLENRSEVSLVSSSPIMRADYAPNDPYYSLQWAYPKIEAPRAWDYELGSGSTVLAVLDTGLDFAHTDLDGRVWYNSGEIAGNHIDDDGNGYVDDYRGWDFVNNDNDPWDDDELDSHGTHVSGIAAAEINNIVGVAGTAQVSIMVLKVLDSWGVGLEDWVRAALDYARIEGAKVVSMSFGHTGSCSPQMTTKLTQQWTAGLVLVASTGNANANAIGCPANHVRVIPVGATTSADVRWVDGAYGSNYGTHLRDNGLVAPGKNIYSTLSSSYGYRTGTSMATPFVSGVAALILSNMPSRTNQQVKTILLNSADDLGSAGKDIYYGYGRLNALRAVLGSEDRPYVHMNTPAGGELYYGTVYVAGYARMSALTPTRAVQQVLVDISNKGCGIFPDWRQAEMAGLDWWISYGTLYPDCDYTVSAKAWDGVNWSNIWSVTVHIEQW